MSGAKKETSLGSSGSSARKKKKKPKSGDTDTELVRLTCRDNDVIKNLNDLV
jgi:hypothetical protein